MPCKKIILPVLVLLGNLPLCAQADRADQIADKVLRAGVKVVKQVVELTPFDVYQQEVSDIVKTPGKEPSYEEVQPALQTLTAYNKFFNGASQEDRAKMAGLLNQPVTVGWNNYRKVPLTEILDRYLPQENKDEDVATLEYNIRLNLLTPVQKDNIELFEDLGNKEVVKFKKVNKNFVSKMEELSSYDTKVIASEFVKVVKAYNQLNEKLPDAAKLAKVSIFVKPIKTGWGRAVAVSKLYRDLTENYYLGGGDGIVYYKTEWLQQRYDISAQDVELLLQFARDYYRK